MRMLLSTTWAKKMLLPKLQIRLLSSSSSWMLLERLFFLIQDPACSWLLRINEFWISCFDWKKLDFQEESITIVGWSLQRYRTFIQQADQRRLFRSWVIRYPLLVSSVREAIEFFGRHSISHYDLAVASKQEAGRRLLITWMIYAKL